MEPDKDADS